MRSYNLKWNERLKDIIMSYAESRKVYIDDIDKINLLLKEKISDDDYHIYSYNDKIKFLIKGILVENDNIVDMVVYLLSNDRGELASLYSELRDESHFGISSLCYTYHYKKEKSVNYFFDDNKGIIKNYERCMNKKKFMLSDIYKLNDISRLELKNGSYYIDGLEYLNESDYKKYSDEYFDKISKGLVEKQLYVVLRHFGSYDKIYKTYHKLLKLIHDEKRKIVGLPMEQYICGRWNVKDENQYVTNIMIPIEN